MFFAIIFPTDAAIYFEDNFDGYSDSPTNHGWHVPSTRVEIYEGPETRFGRCIRHTINSNGTHYSFSHDPYPAGIVDDIYVGFYYKSTHVKGTGGGHKFLKLFGWIDSNDYANITFGQTYQTGAFWQVSYGDGMGMIGDSTCVARYNGLISDSPCSGSIVSHSGPFDLDDSQWHWVVCHAKHNSNDNYDGALDVWIDGELKLSAIGIKNRNDLNTIDWTSMNFVEYADCFGASCNGINYNASPYYVYIDDVIVSDGYIAPPGSSSDTTAPANPTGLAVS